MTPKPTILLVILTALMTAACLGPNDTEATLDALNASIADHRHHMESPVSSIPLMTGDIAGISTQANALQRDLHSIDAKLDNIAVDLQAIATLTVGSPAPPPAQSLPLLPADASLEEAKQLLAKCWTDRGGPLAMNMSETVTQDIVDNLASVQSPRSGDLLSTKQLLALMEIMFGCWHLTTTS